MSDNVRVETLRRLILDSVDPATGSQENESPEAVLAREWFEAGFSREVLFELILVFFETLLVALRDRKAEAVLRGLRLAGLIADPLLYDPVLSVYNLAPIAIEPKLATDIRLQALEALWKISAAGVRKDPVLAARAKAFWLALIEIKPVSSVFSFMPKRDLDKAEARRIIDGTFGG